MWHASSTGFVGDLFPDFSESLNDNIMVARRIELQEAVKKLLKIIFRVDVFLQDHLQHGILEILKWVIGILHHGNAVNDFGSSLDRFRIPSSGLVCWPALLAPDELEEERLGFGCFGEFEVLGLRFGVGSWTSEGFGLPQTQPALGMDMDWRRFFFFEDIERVLFSARFKILSGS
ncbi:hypothetical protein OIU85_028503 [Salix viminalis]|uniref:Uncharacterized protein n=1 Tax=Salix viminalis TaxID=40686 RepID=A0A9Q0TC40_SALVM|nr:hypothetical protein OIU85_028503 [Salix viminalis]